MSRRNKENYYLDMAESARTRCTCLRRQFGAIIVKDDEIIATGYAGAPRGRKNCDELGVCIREKLNIPRGTQYELCRSVHAEANAIISASRKDMIGGTLYLVGTEIATGEYVVGAEPCSMCKRMIINSGIETVVVRDSKEAYRVLRVADWIDNDDSILGKDTY